MEFHLDKEALSIQHNIEACPLFLLIELLPGGKGIHLKLPRSLVHQILCQTFSVCVLHITDRHGHLLHMITPIVIQNPANMATEK